MVLCGAMAGASACSNSGTGDAGSPPTARASLDTTPLSAPDYALYESIMSGASSLLMTLSPADQNALQLAREVDAGRRKATAADEPLLARATALKNKDEELASLQGVAERYRQVKEKVNAVVGRDAQPPDRDDAVAKENRRFLAVHRVNIERLQAIIRDPLSRVATTK
jgi:hypothetical protein